jgi:DMSO/TMAO reductase YedYZ molybdopterin-dependent catalytic subunit
MALDFLKRTDQARVSYGGRVPPSQRVTEGFPVLTYGSPPRLDVDVKDWRFQIAGAVDEESAFTWDEFGALPQTEVHCDIHCVTGWSKLDNAWSGVRFRDLFERAKARPDARYVMVHSFGGYTTNVPLDDLMRDDVLFAHTHNGELLPAEHGGPLRLVVPHLYFWKSAKWVRGLFFMPQDEPGFWEQYGYHLRGDPWKEERYS